MLQRLVHLLPPKVRAQLRRVPWLLGTYRWARRSRIRERYLFAGLALVALVLGLLTTVSARWSPPSALVLVILGGGLVLRVKALTGIMAIVGAVLAVDYFFTLDQRFSPGVLIMLVLTSLLALSLARTRQQLGVQGLRGESMLLELRDRLNRQGLIPPLPQGWDSKVELAQAGGSSFGGDFVVSCRHTTDDDRDLLEIALVDVSGKGIEAGTRALMLSGAFGGLLGSVQPELFLSACNTYLHRQRWDEGFVTAVHVVVDLATGDYTVESAGHPPAVKFVASSGTWQVGTAKGVVLGVVPELKCELETGRLRTGDALMLYTDGLVEVPGRDLDAGIDQLLGEAERLVPHGFRRGAREIVQTMSQEHDDDCALVLVWRT